MATNAANYVITSTPGEVPSDIAGALNRAWEGLRADHAAAAQGPQAQARWFSTIPAASDLRSPHPSFWSQALLAK